MRITSILMAAAFALAAVGATGCGRVIKVVVPDGFSGEARVVYDPDAGQTVACNGYSYVFQIPPEGVLKVRDQAPFYQLHYETVQYANGRKATVARHFAIAGSNALTSSTEFPGTTHVWLIESDSAR